MWVCHSLQTSAFVSHSCVSRNSCMAPSCFDSVSLSVNVCVCVCVCVVLLFLPFLSFSSFSFVCFCFEPLSFASLLLFLLMWCYQQSKRYFTCNAEITAEKQRGRLKANGSYKQAKNRHKRTRVGSKRKDRHTCRHRHTHMTHTHT